MKTRAATPRLALRWTAVVGWMAVIFVLSSIQGSSFPSGPSGVGHFVEYGVLGSLLAWALFPSLPMWRAVAVAVVIGSLYGVTDELHQLLTPERTADVADWGVDTVSAAVGATITALVVTRMHARTRKSPSSSDQGG